MSKSFKNKTAVITGAGSGIGLAIARQLAHRGTSVVVNDIDADRAEKAVAQIESDGGQAVAHPGDAGDVDVVQRLVSRAVDAYGHLDFAIANAGLTLFGDVFSCCPEDFRRLLNVNLQGTFFLVQAASKHMRARRQGGRILLISSNIGVQPHPGLAPYGMTKAALNMLARSLALELAPCRIAINALAPGATVTERTLQDDPNYEQTWQPLIPDGCVARPDDIAGAALFLLSAEAHHITGHTLVIDGGWSDAGCYPTPAD
ncbi:MAG: glucose 1-dehydrogenase [Bacteroidetes bacterium]|nr:glucose 1-dehydrogenase [Bacteroidota bacterium]